MKDSQRICIIGSGKVGTGLSNAIKRIGLPVTLIGKNPEQQVSAVSKADLVLITVQDKYISDVCHTIASALNTNIIVAHCSGALGSEVLQSAKQAGCAVGCAHPLNTFPNKQAAERLFNNEAHHTACFISGDVSATKVLSTLFESLGFVLHPLAEESKVSYHAACVFACNYLSALAELSLNTAERAGLNRDDFWQAIQPLMQSTLSNIGTHGTAAALSGPIARGDVTTIDKHISELQGSNELAQQSYRILGLQALQLAHTRGELDTEQLTAIEALLRS